MKYLIFKDMTDVEKPNKDDTVDNKGKLYMKIFSKASIKHYNVSSSIM